MLTSWSRSECPGQRSCSSRCPFQSAQPWWCHNHPPSPRPSSPQTAHGAGPGGRCWAVRRESTEGVSVFSASALSRRTCHSERGGHGTGWVARRQGMRSPRPLVPQTSCAGLLNAPSSSASQNLRTWPGLDKELVLMELAKMRHPGVGGP